MVRLMTQAQCHSAHTAPTVLGKQVGVVATMSKAGGKGMGMGWVALPRSAAVNIRERRPIRLYEGPPSTPVVRPLHHPS